MNNIEEIKNELKYILSEKRYEHSIGVMEKAIELAKSFGEDEEKSAYVGLVHDIAKEMSDEEAYKYIKQNNIQIEEIDEIETIGLHGKIGAHMAKKKYSFTDEMCRAIYYHTTATNNMTLLDKIIYVADKIEDTRDYPEVNELRKFFDISKNLDEFILYDIDHYTIPKMIEQKRIIHPNSIFARNDIISKLKPEK